MALREQMLEMLDSTRVEERFALSTPLLVAVSYSAIMNANVYLWAERDLHIYVRLLKSWNLNVRKVVCFAKKEFQQVDDVQIVSPQDLLTDATPRKIFFIAETDYTMEKPQAFWQAVMNTVSPLYVHFISPQERAAQIFIHERFDVDKFFYYRSHKRELMELFDSLADETSKRTLFYYVESFVRNCVYRGEQNPTLWKYFFGGKYERLYKHLDGEVWINCGANVGDTIFSYFSHKFTPKKIYAFEGDAKIFNQMLRNLELLPPEKRALVEPINEMIDETTDFEKILAGDKCTLLNADIEGAELPFLHATEKIIRADRPVIAICVYHFKEDLLTVPQFLQSICVDYVWYLRKYTPWYGHLKQAGETVFYAVPKERALR